VGFWAWLTAVREDAGLLTNEFLPEILLVSVVTIVMWLVRRIFRRDVRPH
jgi:hypothetical protein